VDRLCTVCHVKATRKEKDHVSSTSTATLFAEDLRASLTSPTTVIQSPDIVPEKVKEVKTNALGLEKALESKPLADEPRKLKQSQTLVDVGLGIW